ncbi:ATP-binding region ATPase domain protein [Chthoniobacter flavus Ellin428]|uniref:ATP-binding region ATPase domain protein n=1 Tax=Chthoniobacter flavus Ellin428 TaxID=497964 RepID=B4D4A3_9BACT|nr:ATP-binding protein [Chthoniobacter flavus]EDY18704.1 ATP-binding region ATPase domain protein [Chthoniobacter flavus Ellin428]TCO89057.1 histidine kinase/DNA gyrase B/HSP90-like ATPase [Chthoniobacter flavus]
MNSEFEQTALWKTTLAQIDDPLEGYRERLRNEFRKFRSRIDVLTARIQAQLPGLTVHGIAHLDALWESASLLAGSGYPLNPLEGFVLGGAILFHDAALCFEAYDGGVEAVRSSVTWADAYASECADSDARSDQEKRSAADFLALRELHASQAMQLAEIAWSDPATSEKRYLITDDHLRIHLGPLIGRIAASHHWDIEDISSRLPGQFNASGELPSAWRVDPIKIACLLRCADALSFDNNRAPDFLHALLRRRGISLKHWQAQNWIGRPALDISDKLGETIVVTSTRGFPLSEAESWWIAYDAACLAEKEIRSSNTLLIERGVSSSPPFAVKSVRGAGSPETMASLIQTVGWSPCSAEIHVGNIEKLVKTLGGEQLYGSEDKLGVVLRELFQNSRDAISARRFIQRDFVGSIRLRIHRDGDGLVLIIEDDGVGMSKRVLTGPLLDFGTSFWVSSLVRSEFPGLRASGFQSIGRFGIGFYSSFMIADAVSVISRRWDASLESTCELRFSRGLSLRPLLIEGKRPDFSTSTRVILSLKIGALKDENEVLIRRNTMGAKNISCKITEYVAALVAGLDVDVWCVEPNGVSTMVHAAQPLSEQAYEKWLRAISFARVQSDPSLDSYIKENAHRLRPIVENGKLLGMAAISTRSFGQDFLGVGTVGGLAGNMHGRSGERFIGYIDHFCRTAARGTEAIAASDFVMSAWAREQVLLLQQMKLKPEEHFFAACSLSHFKIDPRPIARLLVSYNGGFHFQTFDEVLSSLNRADFALLKSNQIDHVELHHNIQGLVGMALILPLRNSGLSSLKFSAPGIPEANFSIIDCIYRTANERGVKLTWRSVDNVAQGPFGPIGAVVVSLKERE